MRLTKRTIDAIDLTTSELLAWDDDLPGFGLRVKPNGVKSFVIQYRNKHGRSRRMTLGRYGVLTSEEARKAAKVALGDVARGTDPAESKAIERAAISIAELCSEYLAKAEKGVLITRRGNPKKASTIYTDRGRIERHIIPLLGRRTVRDITKADVKRFLDDVIAGKTKADIRTKARGRAIVEGGPGTASRTLGLLGAIFTYAIDHGYRADNPCSGVIKPAGRRRRFRLEASGYKILGDCLKRAETAGEPWQAISAIRVLALTGCRRGEVEKLRREEVDRASNVLRLADSKTGESVRPIGSAALNALTGAMMRSNDQYVFAARGETSRPFAGLPKAFKRIVGKDLPDLTPHKLRHAFSAIAEDLGLTLPTIAALLGHAMSGVTQGYIHKADTSLVAAANRVADQIAEFLEHGGSNNVVELRQVSA